MNINDNHASIGDVHRSDGCYIDVDRGRSKKLTPYEFWNKIGSPTKIVAPMVDHSDLAYRMLCRKYGMLLILMMMMMILMVMMMNDDD